MHVINAQEAASSDADSKSTEVASIGASTNRSDTGAESGAEADAVATTNSSDAVQKLVWMPVQKLGCWYRSWCGGWH